MQLPRIREWRESRGLMQKELAAEANVSEYTVLRAEKGVSLRVDSARKIAEALGVSVADLQERPPVPLGEAPGDLPKVEAPTSPPPDEERREDLLDTEKMFLKTYSRLEDLAETYKEAGDTQGLEDLFRIAVLVLTGAAHMAEEEVLDEVVEDAMSMRVLGAADRFDDLVGGIGRLIEEASPTTPRVEVVGRPADNRVVELHQKRLRRAAAS